MIGCCIHTEFGNVVVAVVVAHFVSLVIVFGFTFLNKFNWIIILIKKSDFVHQASNVTPVIESQCKATDKLDCE